MLSNRKRGIQSFGKSLLLIACLCMPSQQALAKLVMDARELEVPEFIHREKTQSVKRTSWQNVQRNVGRYARNVLDFLGKTEYAKTENEKLASIAYGQGPIERITKTDFITQVEADELLLNPVALYLASHAQTSFGAKALQNMITTFDKEQMLETQSNLKRLVEDDVTYEEIEKQLKQFAHYEGSLLSYWDPKMHQSDHLFAKIKELSLKASFNYSKQLQTGIPIVDDLPNPAHYLITKPSKVLLDTENPHLKNVGTWLRIGSSSFHWLYKICIAKSLSTVIRKIMLEGSIQSPIKNAPKELWAALAVTLLFWKTTNCLQKLQEKHDEWSGQEDPGVKESIAYSMEKELGDIIEKGSFADVIAKTRRELHPQRSDLEHVGSSIVENISKVVRSITPNFVKKGASGLMGGVKKIVPNSIQQLAGNIALGSSMGMKDIYWLLPAFYFLSERTSYVVQALKQSVVKPAVLLYDKEKFQNFVTELAACLRSIYSINDVLIKDEQLKNGISCALLKQSLHDMPTQELGKVIKTVHSSALNNKKITGGHALLLHENMLKCAAELQPALHGIGYLDALFSIAKLIRQNKDKPSRLCFVDWLPDKEERARVDIKNGTLLIMPNAEPNSMRLGFENPSNKAILTGPNGAGKSIFIKMLGSNVILAHAFGIACAESLSMHWLERLRTSIDPAESVADDLSKMQAQKVRMDNVVNELLHVTEKDKTKKGMFLTDEPLSGTTAGAASRKLRAYCDRIGVISQMSGVMATHNEEPTHFEDKGFVNFKVCIKEQGNVFLPSFKVEPGIPEWWFSKDSEGQKKVDNFIDYTVAIKHKSNLEESISSFSKKYDELEELLEEGKVPLKSRREITGLKQRIYIRIAQLTADLEEVKIRIEQLEKGDLL